MAFVACATIAEAFNNVPESISASISLKKSLNPLFTHALIPFTFHDISFIFHFIPFNIIIFYFYNMITAKSQQKNQVLKLDFFVI